VLFFSILQLVERSNKHIQWEQGSKEVSLCALLELLTSCDFVAFSKRKVD